MKEKMTISPDRKEYCYYNFNREFNIDCQCKRRINLWILRPIGAKDQIHSFLMRR